MNKNIKIRKAQEKDFKGIAKIMMKESAKKPYNEKYTLTRAIKEVRKFSKNELYVSIINNIIVGFISSYITADDREKAYVNELWLKLSYQKQGIGKTLMNFIEDKYKKRGIKVIRLVTKKNAGAFNFYKKLKYKETTGLVFLEKKFK